MQWVIDFARSSLGAKVVMALTAIPLVGFVLNHMIGNLLVFAGPDAINTYAATLQSLGVLLWVVRGGLAAAFILHIAAGIRLKRLNTTARPQRYARTNYKEATVRSRWMMVSGLLLLAFVIYHLLHFTGGVTHPEHFSQIEQGTGRHNVYAMVVMGFSDPKLSIMYIVAMFLLGMHVSHGVTSLFQSLGLRTPKYEYLIDKLGPIFATVVVIGNISMPIAVMAGMISA